MTRGSVDSAVVLGLDLGVADSNNIRCDSEISSSSSSSTSATIQSMQEIDHALGASPPSKPVRSGLRSQSADHGMDSIRTRSASAPTHGLSSNHEDPFSDPVSVIEMSASKSMQDMSNAALESTAQPSLSTTSSVSSSKSLLPTPSTSLLKPSLRKNDTASSSPSASAAISASTRLSDPKKVNFWGWVDVGFSHATDEYDRTPIDPEPLTREGAVEVIQMRMEFRKVTQDLLKWREDYENALNAVAATSLSSSTVSSTSSHLDNTNGAEVNVMKEFQRMNPPAVPSGGFKGVKRRPQYPKPTYPQQMYPRQKAMTVESPERTESSTVRDPSSKDVPATTTPSFPSQAAAAASGLLAWKRPSPPDKPAKPSRLSMLVGASQRPSLSPAQVLERPHSHHDATENFTDTTVSQANSIVSSNSSSGPSGSTGSSVAGIMGGFMGRIVPGARWSWNEAVAREHKRAQLSGDEK
jgi:hypothetical protein